MLTPLLELIALILIRVVAVPTSERLERAWLRLYTMVAPAELREARRAEVLSDLHDETADLRTQGLDPTEVAARILLRMARGVKDDAAWSAPFLPSAMAEYLEKGSETISRYKTPTVLVPSLAVLGLMNYSYVASESNQQWIELPLVNGGVLIGSVLMSNQNHLWARRVLNGLLGLMYLLAASVIIWVMVQQRLYEMPDFHKFVLQFALLALSIALILLVASNGFRSRVFGGRWWPVFICWPLIVVTSIGVSAMLGWDPAMLTTVWAVAILSVLLMVIATAVSVLGVALIWYGGLKGSAHSLRLMAAALRNLW